MSKTVLLIVICLFAFELCSEKFDLEPDRIVGKSGDDKYRFLKITDIKFNNRGGFLVTDQAIKSLSLYDKRGKFAGRTTMIHSSSLNAIGVGNNKIYICDTISRRFMVYTHQLGFIKTIPIEGDPVEILKVYRDGSFLTVNNGNSENGKLIKLNPHGGIEYSFFNRAWWGKLVKGHRKHDFVKKYGLALIEGGYGEGQVILGFKESDNPTEIFIYSHKGKKKGSLKYRSNGPYKLNPCSFSEKGVKERFSLKRRDEVRHHVRFSSAFIYKGYKIVFLKHIDATWCIKETKRNMFLVFDKKGNLVQEEDLCNDLTFFDIDKKGRLIGADLKADVVTVQIHKIVDLNQVL